MFLEAARRLAPGGVYVSELHPFRQYEGTTARFVDEQDVATRVPAFTTSPTSSMRQGAPASGWRTSASGGMPTT